MDLSQNRCHVSLKFLWSEVLQSLESDRSELKGRRLGIGILFQRFDVTVVDDWLDLKAGERARKAQLTCESVGWSISETGMEENGGSSPRKLS